MELLVTIFAYLVMLGILSVLIIVHEFGHFLVARAFGFQTPVFGFGLPFGPHWVLGHKWGTEFRFYAFVLGGFVAIPELGDESNQEAFGLPLKPFRKFPIWQRALVAFAGVGFNILFAWLVMLVMLFSIGEPSVQNVIVQSLVAENPIAKDAGVKADDQLLALDSTKVTGTEEAIKFLQAHKNTPLTITVLRAGSEVKITVTPNADGRVGMVLEQKGPVVYKKVDKNPIEMLGYAWVRLCNLTATMIDAVGQTFSGIFSGGAKTGGGRSLGLSDLHGVLAVIKIGADIAQSDWSQLFLFTIYISMDLAIINLLPWPALDGGHLAFMFFEGIRGKPMGERAQGEIVKWGFISLIVLMVVIMVNDVTALMTGKLDAKKKDKDDKIETSAPKAGEVPKTDPATSTPDSSATPTTDSAAPKTEEAAPKTEESTDDSSAKTDNTEVPAK